MIESNATVGAAGAARRQDEDGKPNTARATGIRRTGTEQCWAAGLPVFLSYFNTRPPLESSIQTLSSVFITLLTYNWQNIVYYYYKNHHTSGISVTPQHNNIRRIYMLHTLELLAHSPTLEGSVLIVWISLYNFDSLNC